MNDVLVRIKRLILSGRVIFTAKAEAEMAADGLEKEHALEAIVNAPAIRKVLRSRRRGTAEREKLYVILGMTYDGIVVYTKGKIVRNGGHVVFYVLVSSKRSTNV